MKKVILLFLFFLPLCVMAQKFKFMEDHFEINGHYFPVCNKKLDSNCHTAFNLIRFDSVLGPSRQTIRKSGAKGHKTLLLNLIYDKLGITITTQGYDKSTPGNSIVQAMEFRFWRNDTSFIRQEITVENLFIDYGLYYYGLFNDATWKRYITAFSKSKKDEPDGFEEYIDFSGIGRYNITLRFLKKDGEFMITSCRITGF